MTVADSILLIATVSSVAVAAVLAARTHVRMRDGGLAAQRQREALRVTLASIGDAVITTDERGCITFMNDVAAGLTGWDSNEATGRPLNTVFRTSEQAPEHGSALGLPHHTLLISKDHGQLPIDASESPIRDSEGRIAGVELIFRDISQRRAAEQALERSERELASFFDNASLGLAWVGPDGLVLRSNRAQLDMLGITDADYIGKPFAGFHADGDAMADILAPLARGETLAERPVRMRHADGSVRDVLFRCNALFENGRFVHARCFTQDVTERLRAERAQRESEARFHIMADSAPVLIWMSGPDHLHQWFNRPWLEFTGRDLAQSLQSGWADCVHPEDRQRCLGSYEAAFAARQPFSIDYRLRRHDGDYRWVMDSGVPRFDSEMHFEGFIGSCFDITARKAAEASLARSEAMFRGLSDANLIGVGFGDTSGGTTYLNDEMLRMMGRTRDEFERGGLSWHACLAPEFAHLHETWRAQLLAEGSVSGYERAFLRPDGGRTPYVGAAALLEAGSDFHVRIALDLSRIKKAEEGRLQMVAQLREADRRKDEFLATLAHELRNPLAPALHSLALMRHAKPDPAAHERAIAIVERQLKHMVRLIDDLLDVSRITRDRLELRLSRVEIAQVLEQAIEANRAALDAAGQALELRLPNAPVCLQADPVRLVQVFSNLLGNAAKYSPAGRIITVTLRCEADWAEVAFRDQGMGVSADMLPRIFEMFAQGEQLDHAPHGGLGIGLPLARRLVQLHGGTLHASSPGRDLGSEFVVRLPLQPTHAADANADVVAVQVASVGAALPMEALPAATATMLPPTLQPLPSPRRVLVVDDNHDAATTLALLLQLGGHDTRTAHDGEQALAMAEQFQPEIALLDIGLPLIDGHEVARRLRKRTWASQLVMVALTGWGQAPDRQASRDAGFDAHLVKPVEYDALMQLLNELLAQRVPKA